MFSRPQVDLGLAAASHAVEKEGLKCACVNRSGERTGRRCLLGCQLRRTVRIRQQLAEGISVHMQLLQRDQTCCRQALQGLACAGIQFGQLAARHDRTAAAVLIKQLQGFLLGFFQLGGRLIGQRSAETDNGFRFGFGRCAAGSPRQPGRQSGADDLANRMMIILRHPAEKGNKLGRKNGICVKAVGDRLD